MGTLHLEYEGGNYICVLFRETILEVHTGTNLYFIRGRSLPVGEATPLYRVCTGFREQTSLSVTLSLLCTVCLLCTLVL